jgi:dCMP deaminase
MTETIERSQAWWDQWFLGLAQYVATASKDPSSQVGCVVVGTEREVLTLGYNGLPRGVADTAERLDNRQLKYALTVHAEANAVANASRTGVSLIGGTLYCTFRLCSSCASLVIQAGVRRVVADDVEIPERWIESVNLGSQLLAEAGVIISYAARCEAKSGLGDRCTLQMGHSGSHQNHFMGRKDDNAERETSEHD